MANHKSENIIKWKHEVAKWSSSGLSQHEYCRRMNIPCSTFHGWYSKLKKFDGDLSSCGSDNFVKLNFNKSSSVPDKLSADSIGINILIGANIRISLSRDFDKHELQKTVTSLLEVI